MKIELHHVPVGELVKDYRNNDEEGVTAFSGKLDVRPKYQREFVYNEAQQRAVIDTVLKGFPLNVMYWVRLPDGRFEVMDGQQRTLSICEYVAGHFSVIVNGIPKSFQNLPSDQQRKILDYELMVYFCEGAESEKLEWFRTVNIAGEKLTEQELLNAVYAGTWTADAKRHFSKSTCAAYKLGNKYVNGTPIRQDYLETAIKWINGGDVEGYMSDHQHDPNANALWTYFQNVINWVQLTFPTYRKEMKGIPWGTLYNEFHEKMYDTAELETRIRDLMMDDDVTAKKGIYEYVLGGRERSLSIRAFTPAMKREAYERQQGICKLCKKHFELKDMEADHITPWSQGGKTNAANCQMLCKECNRRKSDK